MKKWDELPSHPNLTPLPPAVGIEGRGRTPTRNLMPVDEVHIYRQGVDVELRIELDDATDQKYLIRLKQSNSELQILDETGSHVLVRLGPGNKMAVFNTAPVVQQTKPALAAYTPGSPGGYSGKTIDEGNTNVHNDVADVDDLNALAAELVLAIAAVNDLRTKYNQLNDRVAAYGWTA
jgi:hypothetical protein